MQLVEIIQARKMFPLWFIGIALALGSACPEHRPQPSRERPNTCGESHVGAIQLGWLFGVAGYASCVYGTMVAATLNRDRSHLAYMWTRPIPRERIAFSYIAVDVIGIVLSYITIFAIAWFVFSHVIFLRVVPDPNVGMMAISFLAIPLMWYGIIEAATSWNSLRGSMASGMSWAVFWLLLGLAAFNFPTPIGQIVAVLNLLNPLAYFATARAEEACERDPIDRWGESYNRALLHAPDGPGIRNIRRDDRRGGCGLEANGGLGSDASTFQGRSFTPLTLSAVGCASASGSIWKTSTIRSSSIRGARRARMNDRRWELRNMAHAPEDRLITYVRGERETIDLDELKALIAIPSISADPAHKPEVRRCAQAMADRMKAAGLERAEILETAGNPVAYGEWLGAPGKPTIAIYGHYDVQPVDPIELWTSPPFDAQVRDGKLYGRGSVDDKGQVLMHLAALEAHLRLRGKLPINVKVIVEGEEEIGSPNFEEFLAEHRERLACDVAVISDTAVFAEDLPSLTVALRGVVRWEVAVHGPSSDLHSGYFGGVVQNPIEASWRRCSMSEHAGCERARYRVPRFLRRRRRARARGAARTRGASVR